MNEEIPSEKFEIQIPEGTIINDLRPGREVAFHATHDFVFKGIEDALSQQSVPPIRPMGFPWRSIAVWANIAY